MGTSPTPIPGQALHRVKMHCTSTRAITVEYGASHSLNLEKRCWKKWGLHDNVFTILEAWRHGGGESSGGFLVLKFM